MKIQLDKIKIAHRGLWNKNLPENSLGAFKRSLQELIPIELDVHMLKDGTLIVIHDDNAKRMTGVDIAFKKATYDDIKDLSLLNTPYHIPKFSDVLKLVDGKVLLDIEIKFDVKNFKICKLINNELKNYHGDVIIKSFNPFYIFWFRLYAKKYMRGLLVSSLKGIQVKKIIKWLTYHMCFNFLAKPDFIAFDKRDLPNKKIEKLHKKGIPILIWTTNSHNEILYNGIIYEEIE